MQKFGDFFVLKDIRASRVNLTMNDYAAGLPSPLSFLGLGDFLARRLELAPWSAKVIPILHKVHVSQGRTKPEMQNESGVFVPIETMEDLYGTVEISLLLHLPGCDSETRLRQALTGLRVAGGLIQNETIRVLSVTADGSAFRNLQRGYAMIPPQAAHRRLIATGDHDSLAAIATTLFPSEREPGFGLIVPCAVGYRLLEDPNTVPQRIRTRSKDIPHVFAEPVLGIAELVSVRNTRLTQLTTTELDALFWSWDAQGDLVLGHSAYHPVSSNPDQPEEVITYG